MFVIALLYLAMPVFIVMFTFFSITFVVPSVLALVIIVFCLNKQRLALVPYYPSLVSYWPLLPISLIITYVCINPVDDGVDWNNYIAVFNLLAERAWPPTYELDGQTWFMRYYLSYFIPTALSIKIFGPWSLMPFLFIYTAIGLCIFMLLAFRNLNKAWHLFIAALVFSFFSGLDLVGAWLNRSLVTPDLDWLIWWTGGEMFAMLSNSVALHLAPHHALAAFLSSSLFLFERRLAVQYGALIFTIVAMWSTFVTIGLLPIAAWALYKEGIRTALTPQNLLAAPLIALPTVLYLTQGTGQIPFMFAWQHINFSFSSFVMFCIFEFLLVLGLLFWFQKEDRSLIITIAVFLTVLCTYRIGVNNDLLHRGAIPAIFAMSILMVKCLLASKGWRKEVLTGYLLIGALPVLVIFVKRMDTLKVDRGITFQEYYDKRPAHLRDAERWHWSVQTDSTPYIFNIPLLREVTEIRP